MTIQVEIPDELFALAEAEAARRGVSEGALVAEALETLLGRRDRMTEAEITATYNRAVAEDPDAFKLDPVLDENARQLLLRSEW